MGILIIDIGTSSIRGSLFSEQGKKLLTEQIHYQPVSFGNGGVEQPVSDWEDSLLLINQKISGKASELQEEIKAIALTSQRSSIIPVTKAGRPLTNAIMWQDTRNREICEELSAYNGLIFRKSGAKVNTVFSGSKMLWIKRNMPEIYKDTYKFVNIPGFLIHEMTGEYSMDYTYGSRSNLMNLDTCEWDEELLEVFEIKKEQLCDLQRPGSVCGRITSGYAVKSGLVEGTPVISAGGDQQCAAVGLGAYKEGVMSIVAGTGAFLVSPCNEIPKDLMPDIICNASAVAGNYIIETNVLTCCSAFDWFCKNFYDSDHIDYERINKELEEAYSEYGECIVLPYFQGRSTPDWNANAKAAITGVTLATRRQDILKAILEGICIEIKNNIELLRRYAVIENACISGGLTNSRIFNQMQADIYGIPLFHKDNCESTTYGALMIALCSLGLTENLDEAFALVNVGTETETFHVNSDKFNEYTIKQMKMNHLYEAIYG